LNKQKNLNFSILPTTYFIKLAYTQNEKKLQVKHQAEQFFFLRPPPPIQHINFTAFLTWAITAAAALVRAHLEAQVVTILQ
jgi:hypothetical protein